MSQYSLRLPDDLHRRAGELAREQGVSLNQFFLYAIADMVAGVEARHFFAERSGSQDREEARKRVDELLARVPDVPADPGDELPPD